MRRPLSGDDRQLWHSRVQVLHLDLACRERRHGGLPMELPVSVFWANTCQGAGLITVVGPWVLVFATRCGKFYPEFKH